MSDQVKRKSEKVSPEDFVRIWQSSETIKEFCDTTKMLRSTASSRAASYRRRGVELKEMPRDKSKCGPPRIEASELNRIAAEANAE